MENGNLTKDTGVGSAENSNINTPGPGQVDLNLNSALYSSQSNVNDSVNDSRNMDINYSLYPNVSPG